MLNGNAIEEVLAKLNPQQRAAATHGMDPLLIVAGAGTGKTTTLVHRVAWLIAQGTDPGRILLLTFTRRAAAEMLRRADGLLRQLNADATSANRVWGGTFHAVATRLLRRFGKAIGLPAEFSIHDQTDSEDLINVVRNELGLAKGESRFPRKATCLSIYSRCVNARAKLDDVLLDDFPWCKDWRDELKKLFDAYVDRKEATGVLDYDDLLLYWDALLRDEKAGAAVRQLFDCVLVDEYQDTNVLQADVIANLTTGGHGLTVVGDDAQSIYSFRAATVRNILDFPKQYPGAVVLTIEQNYRSTQPILAATNQVISQARERYRKDLWSDRADGERPRLVACEDEEDQTEYVVGRILELRERGIDMRRQAVLFRASHHSMLLEAELTRRNIPFHKFGGLKFVETAHVKDLMAFLRLADNPRDIVAGMRVLPLLPSVGPAKARQLMTLLAESASSFSAWRTWKPPAAAAKTWPKFVDLIAGLTATSDPLPAQVARVRTFYAPLVEQLYDNPAPRLRDLEQLELIASRYSNRRRMLMEITLDPPSSTQDLAGPPKLDDDYLVLSTIHSAKGLEWDSVYVIHVSDGNIPSDMATRNPEQIEEELRLFYVALTRAKNHLDVCCPLRYYYRPGMADQHGYAQRSRFLTSSVVKLFDQTVSGPLPDASIVDEDLQTGLRSRNVRGRAKNLWR
jgi:DNA helicase-2/ATP-dependent DNA helicase PcrA